MNDSTIIDALGGTGKTAALCGLHKSAISQWRKRGIPQSWRMFLKATKPGAFRKPKGAKNGR